MCGLETGNLVNWTIVAVAFLRILLPSGPKKSELENSDVNAHVGLHASFNGISIRLVEIKKINCFHSRRVSSPPILMGYAIGLWWYKLGLTLKLRQEIHLVASTSFNKKTINLWAEHNVWVLP